MKTVILELNQTPYENGKKSGEYFSQFMKDEIQKDLEKVRKDEFYINRCKELYQRLKDEYPVYFDELRGKAKGLHVDPFDFFTLHCPELNNVQKEQCSTIICKKDNGHFIISHNEDDCYVENNFCLSKVWIDENNYFITNDMYNMPFGNGPSINTYGIIKTINYLHDENHEINHLDLECSFYRGF